MVREIDEEKLKHIIKNLEERKHSPEETHSWIQDNRKLIEDAGIILSLPIAIALAVEYGASPLVTGLLALGEGIFSIDLIRRLKERKERAIEKLKEVL